MTSETSARTRADLLDAARRIAQEVAAPHAAAVDSEARFPVETIQALQRARLLSAQLPSALGGAGLGMHELGEIVSALAERCAASAMVLAMHYNQVACLVRHAQEQAAIKTFLQRLVTTQWLVASMTSEVGTAGDMRRSVCAVRREGAHFRIEKEATTGSYCEHADAILVSARRHPDAAPSDQVLVLVLREQRSLIRTSNWDTLGMRGTCSPGFQLSASGPVDQILPEFGDIAAMSMVPYSHILWSALWTGIASGATQKAAAFVRQQARSAPGTVPPGALRLAAVTTDLQAMRHNWEAAARKFDRAVAQGLDAQVFSTLQWALEMNNLKIASSEAAPQIVHAALQVIGVVGYKNDSPFSVGREYRDALSGALMISNDRLSAASASILLVSKEAPGR